jgi:hypothetical protein
MQNSKRSKMKTAADIGERHEEIEKGFALKESKFDAGIAIYLHMVVSLIEGRRIRMDAILEMMARIVRQRSMARRRKIDYVLEQLMANAP